MKSKIYKFLASFLAVALVMSLSFFNINARAEGTEPAAATEGNEGTEPAAPTEGNEGTEPAAPTEGNEGTEPAAPTEGNEGTVPADDNLFIETESYIAVMDVKKEKVKKIEEISAFLKSNYSGKDYEIMLEKYKREFETAVDAKISLITNAKNLEEIAKYKADAINVIKSFSTNKYAPKTTENKAKTEDPKAKEKALPKTAVDGNMSLALMSLLTTLGATAVIRRKK